MTAALVVTVALEECEQIIERGLHTFMEVGSALLRIRDDRLYRNEYRDFETYCQNRWSMSRPRAYELMGAADIVGRLSGIPDIPLPVNMGQAEELIGLDTPTAAQVMTEAHTVSNGKPTATVNLTLAFTEVCAEMDAAGYSEERIAYQTGETVNRVARTLDKLDGLRNPYKRAPSIEPVKDSGPDSWKWVKVTSAADRAALVAAQRANRVTKPPLAPCGTVAAYRRHKDHKKTPCDLCRAAYQEAQRARHTARKEQS